MVSRRALLAAGAGAVLAGCGPAETPVASRKDVLDEQLRLTRIAAAAGAPAAAARAKELEAAGATGTPPAGGPTGPRAAYDAERRALAGYVAAIGELSDAASRALLGGLVVDAAQSEAELARRLKLDPLPTAFPGQPA